MDCLLLCNKDLPEICAGDVKELIGKECTVMPSICIVEDISTEEIATLAYHCQSAHRIIPLLTSFDCPLLDPSEESVHINSLGDFLKDNTSNELGNEERQLLEAASTFALRVSKTVHSDLPSPDIEEMLGGWYHDRAKANSMELGVDLDRPELPIHAILTNDKCFVGVDVIGFDLSRRPYKLLPYPSSLNGVMAYTIARAVGLTRETVVLDPFCGSGTIPIEASLYQNGVSPFTLENSFAAFSIPLFRDAFENVRESTREQELTITGKVTGYDNQFKVMTLAKKHAKIAHIKDALTISKVDIDWVDMKFDEDSVDVIITNPPKENRKANNYKEIRKLYDDFCYQIRHILKPTGRAGVLLIKPQLLVEAAKPHNLEVEQNLTIHSGEQEYQLVILKKRSDEPAKWD
ncbi:MAG: THUMP domain-containing protein [Candidatus Woesearchaeota archaeon]